MSAGPCRPAARRWLVVLVAVCAPVVTVRAHHSFAMFDKTQTVTLIGTVKSFEWTNPHSYIVVLVPSPGAESVEWLIETGAPGSLTRLDSRWHADVIKPGDKVTAVINPLRSGEKGGALVDVTTATGLVLGQHAPN